MEHSKIVWLTGATSGIGKALTVRFLNEGMRVALTGRNKEKLEQFITTLDVQEGRLLAVPADVAIKEDIESGYSMIKSTWGVPDMVIANAGTHINMPASEITVDKCRKLFEINLIGAVSTLLVGLPDMLERGSGHLVGVGSLSSYRGLPLAAAYGASKAGLNNFLQSLRFDVETYGLSVTAINPGFVRTPLTDRNTYPMPMIIEADQAAEYIWSGLSKRKMEIHFPPAFSWTCKFLRILPYQFYHALVRRFTGSAKRRG
jgi:short-subunit dehydrogenase